VKSNIKQFAKKSEKQVTKECIDLLKVKQIIHWRNNVLDGKFRGSGEKNWRHVKNGVPGLSDWSFLLNDGSGRCVFLELKKTGGKQSQNQIDFQADCERRLIPYYCVDDVIDLKEILDIYGM